MADFFPDYEGDELPQREVFFGVRTFLVNELFIGDWVSDAFLADSTDRGLTPAEVQELVLTERRRRSEARQGHAGRALEFGLPIHVSFEYSIDNFNRKNGRAIHMLNQNAKGRKKKPIKTASRCRSSCKNKPRTSRNKPRHLQQQPSN